MGWGEQHQQKPADCKSRNRDTTAHCIIIHVITDVMLRETDNEGWARASSCDECSAVTCV